MYDLTSLSMVGCIGLTDDIDLTTCSEITQVDASGTTVNVLVPTGTKVTKYEVGAPTSISLINPTSLTPAGVLVDNYANLDSLVLKNVSNTNTYALFDKITDIYTIGGNLMYGYTTEHDGSIVNSDGNHWVSSRIQLPDDTIIFSAGPHTSYAVLFYNTNGDYYDWTNVTATSPYTLTPNMGWYVKGSSIILRGNNGRDTTITANSTGQILFKSK